MLWPCQAKSIWVKDELFSRDLDPDELGSEYSVLKDWFEDESDFRAA